MIILGYKRCVMAQINRWPGLTPGPGWTSGSLKLRVVSCRRGRKAESGTDSDRDRLRHGWHVGGAGAPAHVSDSDSDRDRHCSAGLSSPEFQVAPASESLTQSASGSRADSEVVSGRARFGQRPCRAAARAAAAAGTCQCAAGPSPLR
jgi:hypothetical protein